MIKQERIQSIIRDALQERNLFLVEIAVTPAGKIAVYIDSMNGVTIDDCAGISRMIETSLDRNEEDYELEVSSPGPDRSLLLPEQYKKNISRKVDVLKKDGIRHQGILKSYSGDHITIESVHMVKNAHSGKRQKESRITEIGIDQVLKAKIIVS